MTFKPVPAMIVALGMGVAVIVGMQVMSGNQDLPEVPDRGPVNFLKGHFVTFASRTFVGPANDAIEGLPAGFSLRALSDNHGGRLRGIKFILTIDDQPVDQQALAHKTGEDVLLSTNRGTLRARVLNWLDFDDRDATASGVEVQFDFMLPKD